MPAKEKTSMRDPKVETNCLSRHNYTWKFEEAYKLDRIDWKEAADNPARIWRPYDEEYMFRMALQMENGYVFPPIVVFDVGLPKDLLATGYHRGQAAKYRDIHIFPAYRIAEPDPYRRAILPSLLNAVEGKSQTREEIFYTVIGVLERFPGTKARDLCIMHGITEAQLSEWKRARAAQVRAEDLGVGTMFSRFPKDLRMKIDKIGNDNTYVGVVDCLHFTRDYQAQTPDDFVKDIYKHGKTEIIAQRMMEQRRKDYLEELVRYKQERGEAKTPQATSTRYMGKINSLIRFRRVFSVAALQLAGVPAAKRPSALNSVCTLITHLTEVKEAIEQLIAADEREISWRKDTSTRTGAHPSAHTSPST
jgi:hypothetical protein